MNPDEYVKKKDIVTYDQIAQVCGDALGSKDPIQQLRRWRSRGHIKVLREDLPAVFDWAEVRPIIAERCGQPASKWAKAKLPPSRT